MLVQLTPYSIIHPYSYTDQRYRVSVELILGVLTMFQLYGLHFNSIYDALNFGKGSFEYIQYTLEYQTYILHRRLSATLIPYLRTIRKLERQA